MRRASKGLGLGVCLPTIAALAAACGLQVNGAEPPAGTISGDGGAGSDGQSSQKGDGGATSGGDDGGSTPTKDGGAQSDGPPVDNTTVVYPMTGNTLYAFDVVSHALAKLGSFSACNGGGLREIAVDATGAIWGISSNGLFQVNQSGTCTSMKNLDQAGSTHGISFPPLGQAGIYALQDGSRDLFTIDTSNGTQATTLTDAFPDDSGPDLVCSSSQCWEVMKANSTGCSGGNTDCIYRFDAGGANGSVVGQIAGNHNDVRGLAYAQGKLYAFCGNGDIVEMPPTSPGQAHPITATLGAGISSVPGWQGAGSTNAAQ